MPIAAVLEPADVLATESLSIRGAIARTQLAPRCSVTYFIRRLAILEDVGDSLSPLVDRGQIEGGFIQGVGWLTLEELVWDSKGRLATAGAPTYKLPSWTEIPDVFECRLSGTSGGARHHFRR